MSVLNVNQFALPGMEELSRLPATAKALAKGFRFEVEPGEVIAHHDAARREDRATMLGAEPGTDEDKDMGLLYWNDKHRQDDRLAPGEIGLVETATRFRRQGVGEAMYEIARTGRYGHKVKHSSDRTAAASAWAETMRKRGQGGSIPKLG